MAWTELTRRQHAREGDKYASDLTDAEWASIAPFMPPPKTTGRPRTTSLRDVFNDDRLPVADAAQRFSAGFDGMGLFLCLAQ
jgi:transposase